MEIKEQALWLMSIRPDLVKARTREELILEVDDWATAIKESKKPEQAEIKPAEHSAGEMGL